MIVGKNSWKALLLLLYVAISIIAAIGCFTHKDPVMIGTGVALLLCNGRITYDKYKSLNNY